MYIVIKLILILLWWLVFIVIFSFVFMLLVFEISSGFLYLVGSL